MNPFKSNHVAVVSLHNPIYCEVNAVILTVNSPEARATLFYFPASYDLFVLSPLPRFFIVHHVLYLQYIYLSICLSWPSAVVGLFLLDFIVF